MPRKLYYEENRYHVSIDLGLLKRTRVVRGNRRARCWRQRRVQNLRRKKGLNRQGKGPYWA
jgi:hypothetical protein